LLLGAGAEGKEWGRIHSAIYFVKGHIAQETMKVFELGKTQKLSEKWKE